MKRLAVIGGGDLGQLIAHHARTDAGFEIVGFFDDAEVRGEGVLGSIGDCRRAYGRGLFDCFAMGIGYRHPALRASLFEDISRFAPPATLVHSSCFVDTTAEIGDGAVLLPGCVVDKGVILEGNVLLNTSCAIAHDTRIGRNSFLGPRVALAGFVHVGDSCFLGINSTVIDGIEICAGVQTGAGTVVTKHVTEPGLYVGVPARRVR